MASIFRRKDSSFWWINYLDISGKRRNESTKYRHAVTADTRKARELCRELSEREREGLDASESWDSWVPALFKDRYCNSPKTLNRALLAWRNISAFFESQNIVFPRQLSRQHVRDFIRWRQ